MFVVRAARQSILTLPGRSAILAAVVIGVGMTLGAILLLAVFRGQLHDNLDRTLTVQAEDRARLISAGTDPAALVTIQQGESLVWIGTPDGSPVVVGGSIQPAGNPVPDNLDGVSTRRMLVREVDHEDSADEDSDPEDSDPEDSDDEEDHEEDESDDVESKEFRVASAVTDDGSLIVLVAAESEQISNTVGSLAALFLVAVPILVIVAAALAYASTKRALTSVARIRRQTTEVSATNLSSRVTVPEARDEIHHLAITMNQMLDRLETHERSLREFTANASHELKSPVANIRALVETADLPGPEGAQLKTRVSGETERLRDLVDNLLFLARHGDTPNGASAPTPATALVETHLDDLLFDEAELVAATGGTTVNIDDVGPVAVQGIRSDLGRLVRNLVDNAVRHATASVWLASGDDPRPWLAVADDGPGIPASDRERVFERFTRLDEGRARDDGGSGLGLAIVKRIAEDHGATVSIGDRAGGGAVVTVTFPSRGVVTEW